ncbi:MAG: hypothetical protein QHI48_03315 [Bacteroidota bacterium]|nr:hypothetical protein [Bacteroidota bacterium]
MRRGKILNIPPFVAAGIAGTGKKMGNRIFVLGAFADDIGSEIVSGDCPSLAFL